MILDDIIDHKRRELSEIKQQNPLPSLQKLVASRKPGGFSEALKRPERVSLIAEIKKASPSRGVLCAEFDPSRIAEVYADSGASAISVLTDSRFFQGDASHLIQAKEASGLPVLRKDFIIDEYQLWETAAMGADAVLLIVAALSAEQLGEYIKLAHDIGLGALVETHDSEQLNMALEAGAEIIGINNRDLKTFRTDLNVTLKLAPEVPPGHIIVSESGIHTADDVRKIRQAGVDAILVGEALMTSTDIPRTMRELIGDQG